MNIEEIKGKVSPIAKKHGAKHVYLFGSYAHGEATEKSDIDFEIDPGEIKSFLKLAGFLNDLEAIFNLKVDIITTKDYLPGMAEIKLS